MNNNYWEQIHNKTTKWIKEAGEILSGSLTEQIDVQFKTSHDDLVTNMDKQIEQFFIKRINDHYPNHRVVSEEGFGDDVESTEGILWLIDPIDGTMNYVHQRRHFAISIGIYEDGVGRVGFIYDVIARDLYHCIKGQGAFINQTKLPMLAEVKQEDALFSVNATWVNRNRRIDPDIIRPIALSCRGTRSYGSAAIELAYVAAGTLDAYFTMRLAPWDYGAGLILLEEVGGVATRVDGSPIDLLKQNSVLAGKKGLQQGMVNHIQKEIKNGKFIDQKK